MRWGQQVLTVVSGKYLGGQTEESQLIPVETLPPSYYEGVEKSRNLPEVTQPVPGYRLRFGSL